MTADAILAEVGRLVLYVLGWSVSVACAAWAAFKFAPEQWLRHRFDRQLEQQRADHARALQEARHRLDVLLRQTSKLHEKEFEVLAEVWGTLNEAQGHVADLVASFQQFPDLDRMSEDRFEAFVKGSILEDIDKQELRAVGKHHRNGFYQERIFWYRLRDAKRAWYGLHTAIQRNSIFFEPQIRERFIKINAALRSSLIEREIGQESGDPKMWIGAGTKFASEVAPLKAEIERLVQKRLGYE
jgi:hypothetical protein